MAKPRFDPRRFTAAGRARIVPHRKKPTRNAVARATFHHLAEMTPAARAEIARWLRRQAAFIQSHGDECASRFTARFWWH